MIRSEWNNVAWANDAVAGFYSNAFFIYAKWQRTDGILIDITLREDH